MAGPIARLTAHADRLVASTNLIALVLAWNAPFYPLYVWWVAGARGMPWALLTGCALPVFAAVPFVSRASGMASRLLLSLAGTANVVFCTWVLGWDAGVALFLLPCVMLAALMFRPNEAMVGLPLAALPIAAGLLLQRHLPAPPFRYDAGQYAGLLSMNAFSAGTLTLFLGISLGRGLSALEKLAEPGTAAGAGP